MPTTQLHPLFTNHAVLQRNIDLPIWGTAAPHQKITIALLNQKLSTTADASGHWKLSLAPLDPGGPHTLTLTDSAGATLTLSDLLIGDVYLCSGQSNMQWTVAQANNSEAETAAATYPGIRFFQVPRVPSLTPLSTVDTRWAPCTPATALGFSAVGFFFGREIHLAQRVPIGLIDSSWGGTVCEAWTSLDALAANPLFAEIMKIRAAADQADPSIDANREAAIDAWEDSLCQDPGNAGEALGYHLPDHDTSDWKPFPVPGAWQRYGLNMHGAAWFRTTIDLPPDWLHQDLTLALGAIDDYDHAYVNGTRVGGLDRKTRDTWNIQRRYPVPAALLKPGKNTIAVRVFDKINDGGMMGPAVQMSLAPVGSPGLGLPLAGTWLSKVELELPVRPFSGGPAGTNLQNIAAGLFNSMIHPLIPFALKGALWYQGESNADRAHQYRTLFPTMIQNWRTLWQQKNPSQTTLPFYYVELARWRPAVDNPAPSAWAELREAQRCALQLPHTGFACIIDTGDAIDIHPPDKQTPAHRLALVAQSQLYHAPIDPLGPTLAKQTIQDSTVTLTFTHATALTTSDQKPPRGFALAGEDKNFFWADARIENNSVILHSPHVLHPIAARYAWADNPDCNLSNTAGLPMPPFRTDTWKGLTDENK